MVEGDAGKDDGLNRAIIRLARRHRYRAGRLLSAFGLHPGQEAVLRLLSEQGEQSQAALAAGLEVEPPTVHRSLLSLERSGLVCRRPSTLDGRITVVSLTDAGRDVHSRVAAAWEQLCSETGAGFSEEERGALVRLLDRASANLTDPGVIGDC